MSTSHQDKKKPSYKELVSLLQSFGMRVHYSNAGTVPRVIADDPGTVYVYVEKEAVEVVVVGMSGIDIFRSHFENGRVTINGRRTYAECS